ncbi:MAG: alpha/beta hydrolase [Clostridia bacterium]|nr:alpha/beta hydrolase [Clostridia bacterium]
MTDERKQQLISDFNKFNLTDAERAKTEGSYISLPSGNTHYEIRGEGELCVLVHGYAVGYFIYDNIADGLVKNGYKVLRYDLLGRGLSERVKGKYDIELFVKQLEDVIEALAGGESFNLFATSMGAPVANAYCAKHPEKVKKLIFYAPAGMDTFKPPFYMYLSACPLIGDFIFANWGEKVLFKNVTREMKHVDIDPYLEKLAESFRYKGFSRCTLSSLRHTILKTKKSTAFFAEAAKKNIPTLCVWGNADITMPFYMAERFREIVPDAEFHELDGSGHVFIYDEADKAMQWTLPFLKK